MTWLIPSEEGLEVNRKTTGYLICSFTILANVFMLQLLCNFHFCVWNDAFVSPSSGVDRMEDVSVARILQVQTPGEKNHRVMHMVV